MNKGLITREFFRFNTTNTISAVVDDESILDEAVAHCTRYELLFSCHNPESQLYQLNHAGGAPTQVDPELALLIKKALTYCQETQGLFDITMGSITHLWDFKNETIPAPTQIENALSHVDYQKIEVHGSTVVITDPDAYIDLGGIAKGYIADAALEFLRKHGVQHALVNLGGNVAVMGGKPDGTPWRIGIRKPLPSTTLPFMESFAAVDLFDGSTVTSGVYERAFWKNNTLYHHILNPQTGFPAETDLLSATVLSKASLDGDGYTTALVAMGAQAALTFAQTNPRIEAILVTREGDVLATSEIGERIAFQLL